jgi:hypothetical protein
MREIDALRWRNIVLRRHVRGRSGRVVDAVERMNLDPGHLIGVTPAHYGNPVSILSVLLNSMRRGLLLRLARREKDPAMTMAIAKITAKNVIIPNRALPPLLISHPSEAHRRRFQSSKGRPEPPRRKLKLGLVSMIRSEMAAPVALRDDGP